MKIAQTHDGNVFHFDDDTSDDEIDKYIQNVIQESEEKKNETKSKAAEHAEKMQVSLHVLVLIGELVKVGRENNELLKSLIHEQVGHHDESREHGENLIKAIKAPRSAVRDKNNRVIRSEIIHQMDKK